MRAVLYFNDGEWAELGMLAIDEFLQCLDPDENGRFDCTFQWKKSFAERAKSKEFLGFKEKRDKFLTALDSIKEGSFVYMSSEWQKSEKGIRYVRLLNFHKDKDKALAILNLLKEGGPSWDKNKR